MKILITADLHFRQHWFGWLIEQGTSYDLICIAGDLLDMFFREPRIVQGREVRRWIRELAKVTRVAICSGNHDNAGQPNRCRPGARIRVACRVRKRAKYYHRRGNGDRKRLDRHDRSVSLF